MFVSRSVLKKKLCANFSEKKNITESNNLGPSPPPPQKSNGASLTSYGHIIKLKNHQFFMILNLRFALQKMK